MLVTDEKPKDKSKGAFWLNAFLPGAGFLYLRRWKLAALNLAGALAVGLVITLLTGGRDLGIFSSTPAFMVGLASGFWAETVAQQMQESAEKAVTLDEISDQAGFR